MRRRSPKARRRRRAALPSPEPQLRQHEWRGRQPIFGRLGGKTKVANLLLRYLPSDARTYVEPFAGAATLFFRRAPAEREVINDLDPDIYAMFRDFQRLSPDAIRRIDLRFDEDKFHRLLKSRPTDPAQRLARNLYLSYNSYSNNRHSPRGPPNPVAVKRHSAPFLANFQKHVDWYKRRLRDATLSNRDYRAVMREYDAPDTLFYLDPPYVIAQDRPEMYDHHRVDPFEVAKVANAMRGRVAVSYDDLPVVREAFRGWHVTKIPIHYSVNASKIQDTHELLLTNYDPKTFRRLRK